MEAKELFSKHFDGLHYEDITPERIEKYAIEFARYHVEQALKEASEKAVMYDDNEDCHFIDEEGNCPEYLLIDRKSILNSYSLENIK